MSVTKRTNRYKGSRGSWHKSLSDKTITRPDMRLAPLKRNL